MAGEMSWVGKKIHLYNVTMGLYMLDWWERCLFNILVLILLWFICLNGSRFASDVFERYVPRKPGVPGPGVPDENDFDNARKLAEFLGHFADVTKRVSASLSVTAHTYFDEIGEVNQLVNEWMSSSDLLQQEMGRRMKEKFDKYWGQSHENLELQNEKGKGKEKEKENINLLIFVAAVLDPRYKLSQYTELAVEEMYGEGVGQKVWAAITKCLHDLFEEYMSKDSPNEVQSRPSDSPPKQGAGNARKLKAKISKKMKLTSGTSSCSRGSRSELDRYLAEECEEDSKKLDILAWWKGQPTRFPILSQLARDVLAIPISTVATESVFSTSGRILDDFRSSLTPFMIEALVCTQDWLRRSTLLEDTKELTKLEEELIQEFKDIAIVDGHAAKSTIQGSKKKMVTSTNISSQPSKSSKQSKSSKESKNNNSSKDK